MPLIALPLLFIVGMPPAVQTPKVRPPAKIEQTGEYTNGAWDVGLAILAGQPTEATLRKLKEKGYTLVVNFRTPSEMANRQYVPFDEEALLKELGIKYVHIPMGGQTGEYAYGPHTIAKLAEATKGHEGKALVHCTVGWRASYAWTAYIHKHQGLTLDEAVRHGQAMEVSSFLEKLLGTDIAYTPKASGGGSGGGVGSCYPGPSSEWISVVDPNRAMELQREGALVLDVRANYMEYIDGHLKGAVHLDANSLRGPRAGLPVQYRTDDEMAETLRRAGVRKDRPVVVYANPGDVLNATMTAYVLEKLGAPKSYFVNGGSVLAGAAGLVEKPIPTVSAGDFSSSGAGNVTATLDDVRKAIAPDSGVTLIDARPPAQYTGEQKLWVRNGHIPGAISVFWRTLTQEDNAHVLRSKSEIQAIFDGKGIKPDQDVIVYCGTSKEATLIWMVLSRELGFKKVRVFEGAWTEYASRTDLPLVTGTSPR